jgi:hypothetical protein
LVNTKDRRHSGRVIPVIYDFESFPYNLSYWDDWNNYRDGFRDLSDRTIISKNPYSRICDCESCREKIKSNKKNKLLLLRRKARKYAKRLKSKNIYDYSGLQ